VAKFSNLTLKCDILTLKMTSGGAANDNIELAGLKNPYMDPSIV